MWREENEKIFTFSIDCFFCVSGLAGNAAATAYFLDQFLQNGHC